MCFDPPNAQAPRTHCKKVRAQPSRFVKPVVLNAKTEASRLAGGRACATLITRLAIILCEEERSTLLAKTKCEYSSPIVITRYM